LPGLDISGQTERTYINQVITDTTAVVDDFWWGTSAGHSLATFTGAVTATMGGQMFIAADAAAQADVVMTWGTNSVYRGKITGFTNANTITLSPAPPALTGQAVQFWIGRVSVPATTTTINATGTTGNLYLSFNKDVFSYRDSLTSCRFRGVVEHWGGRFYPRFTVSGSVTADFVNLYADRDVYYLPSGTISDLCGGDNNYSSGGGGGHDPSVLAERITRRVYEALDFCAA
jgi:hypothetical protein